MRKLFSLIATILFAGSMMAVTIENIDFRQGQGNWSVENVSLASELTYVWLQNSTYGMKASTYKGGNHEAQSWLISPSMNLSGANKATLTIRHACNYGSIEGLYVVARIGESGEWNVLSLSQWPTGSDWNWVVSTADMSAYAGYSEVYVAFAYFSSADNAPTWEISNVSVNTHSDYYLAGTMNSWRPNENYKFAENQQALGEYMLTTYLTAGQELKVAESLDGWTFDDYNWYPGGSTSNFTVSESGMYNIYFRPDGLGGTDWYNGYFFLELKTPIDISIYNANEYVEYLESGLVQFYGESYPYDVGLSFWVGSSVEGSYTMSDLDTQVLGSGVYSYEEGKTYNITSASISVEYESSADVYYIYATLVCDNNETYSVTMVANVNREALDNVFSGKKAVKTIENGRLIIEKNNVRFNANGARL